MQSLEQEYEPAVLAGVAKTVQKKNRRRWIQKVIINTGIWEIQLKPQMWISYLILQNKVCFLF